MSYAITRATLAFMSDGPVSTQGSGDRIVFQVEVVPGTDPIRGLLRVGESELGFVGWVALAGALERAFEAGDARPQGQSQG